jgi:hypothetical protein
MEAVFSEPKAANVAPQPVTKVIGTGTNIALVATCGYANPIGAPALQAYLDRSQLCGAVVVYMNEGRCHVHAQDGRETMRALHRLHPLVYDLLPYYPGAGTGCDPSENQQSSSSSSS